MVAEISSFNSGSYTHYQNQYDSVKKNGNDEGSSIDTKFPKISEKEESNLQEQARDKHLKSRDQEVKTHEQAHLNAAGGLATSGASFSFTKGADGTSYATGGEVGIDTSPVNGDPAATIRKADVIRRAALAPASPSAQDQSVANKAAKMAAKARSELMQETQKMEEGAVNLDKGAQINFSV